MAVATRAGRLPRLRACAARVLLLWGALAAGCDDGEAGPSGGGGRGPRLSGFAPNGIDLLADAGRLRLRAFSHYSYSGDNVPEGESATTEESIRLLTLLVDIEGFTATVERSETAEIGLDQAAAQGLIEGPATPGARWSSYLYHGWDLTLPWVTCSEQVEVNEPGQDLTFTCAEDGWTEVEGLGVGVLRLDSLVGGPAALLWRQGGNLFWPSVLVGIVDCRSTCCRAYRFVDDEGEELSHYDVPRLQVGTTLALASLPQNSAAGVVDVSAQAHRSSGVAIDGSGVWGVAGDQAAREIVCGAASPRPLSEWADFEACDFYDLMTNPAHYCP